MIFPARKKKEAEMQKRKDEFGEMLKRQLELHVKSRTQRYPAHDPNQLIHRVSVPDEKVPWEVSYIYCYRDQLIKNTLSRLMLLMLKDIVRERKTTFFLNIEMAAIL